MPAREVLTPAQRKALLRFPRISEGYLARYYTLTEEDKALIGAKRGNHNRLGFALHRACLRFPGCAWNVTRAIPGEGRLLSLSTTWHSTTRTRDLPSRLA